MSLIFYNWRAGVLFLSGLLALCCSGGQTNNTFNRLQHASSPYLRQHADNPVDWFEWGPEALAKAKRENKPIIISVGYASCHWCHVMEEESFMDTAVARRMNDHFVSIKIDREERPDIDQIYLEAAQLLSGNSGWPLNAFSLPDGKPFYAATYFPKEEWINLLDKVVVAYKDDYDAIKRQASALTDGIQSNELDLAVETKSTVLDKKNYASIADEWQPFLDYQNGGLKGSPKFLMPVLWEHFLQRYVLTKEERALKIVTTTLDKLSGSGMYDHLAGGFARYATDSSWRIPHFEKMLYDNAQMVSLYSHAIQLTGKEEYEHVVHQTLRFIEQELSDKNGGFYSSINADSEGEEGKYYVWTKDEIEQELSADEYSLISDFYDISKTGNWEAGKNILIRKTPTVSGKQMEGLSSELRRAETKLFEARNKRTRPSTDNKIISSWNGLMLKAYVDAFLATGEDRYLGIALKNAGFIQKNLMNDDGHLFRIYINGKASVDGFLDDYTFVARAFIQLYQATFDVQWLEASKLLTDYALKQFDDKYGELFHYAENKSENLVVRQKEIWDNVIPSSNAVLAEVLVMLGEYYANQEYSDAGKQMVTAVFSKLRSAGPHYAYWASLAGIMSYSPYEVAIVGTEAIHKARTMQKVYNPTAIYMGGNSEILPLLANKLVAGRTMIYVCRNRICKSPETEVDRALLHLR